MPNSLLLRFRKCTNTGDFHVHIYELISFSSRWLSISSEYCTSCCLYHHLLHSSSPSGSIKYWIYTKSSNIESWQKQMPLALWPKICNNVWARGIWSSRLDRIINTTQLLNYNTAIKAYFGVHQLDWKQCTPLTLNYITKLLKYWFATLLSFRGFTSRPCTALIKCSIKNELFIVFLKDFFVEL
jgi:hypothetical protein